MKIALVHISDIHFSQNMCYVKNRAVYISKAVSPSLYDVDGCIIVISGDIAFSGKQSEYQIAKEFIRDLREQLAMRYDNGPVHLVIVPGNHDCNFEGDLRMRNYLVDDLPKYVDEARNQQIIEQCLCVQKEFFNFYSSVKDEQQSNWDGTINAEAEFKLSTKIVKFNLYNTAWVSQRDEHPGQLQFPYKWTNIAQEDFDLIISIFHHPVNWFQPKNASGFRQHLEETSDIVITGHEHAAGYYTRQDITGETSDYLEGTCLQEENTEASGFNLLLIDIDECKKKVMQFNWQSSIYACEFDSEWKPMSFSRKSRKRDFQNNDNYLKYLDDIGAAFTHPHIEEVKLRDIFIYPDLRDASHDKKTEDPYGAIIEGGDLLDYIIDHRYVIITGAEKAGKTALAKKIYSDLHQKAMMPLLINESTLSKTSAESIDLELRRNFETQYQKEAWERYCQLDVGRKVLLIDDFDAPPLNEKRFVQSLAYLSKLYGAIILLGSDVFQVGELSCGNMLRQALVSFRRCELRNFGYKLRSKLIDKWVFSDCNEATEILTQKQRKLENYVNAILSTGLIPSYPLYVLMLIQTFESNADLNMTSASYGFFCEYLIMRTLPTACREIQMDTKKTFLAHLAYSLFNGKRKSLDRNEFDKSIEDYCSLFKVRIPCQRILEELKKILILNEIDGQIQFKYPYIYYYFVAKYFQENLYDPQNGESLRVHVTAMAEKVYIQDYANIIIFLIYLTKDVGIIGQILENSKMVYNEYEPCDLEADISFLKNISVENPKLSLLSADPRENRQRLYKSLDRAETRISKGDESESSQDDETATSNIIKMNVAFKMLQIIGQILRSFPGSLRADLKEELMREGFLVGLRTLNSIMTLFRDNYDEIVNLLSSSFKEKFPDESEGSIKYMSDNIMYFMALFFTYGIIKKVSYSLGSEQLHETYSEIIDEMEMNSAKLISVSIKLDHYPHVPEAEILRLYKSIERDAFNTMLLRILVFTHFSFYECNFKTRQRICSKLNIALPHPGLHEKPKLE